MPRRPEIDEVADELYPDDKILLLEPRDLYDPALVGIAEKFMSSGNHVPFAVYDEDQLIDLIAGSFDEDDLDEDDDRYTMAREHFEFNIRGGYVGEEGPAFIRVLEP